MIKPIIDALTHCATPFNKFFLTTDWMCDTFTHLFGFVRVQADGRHVLHRCHVYSSAIECLFMWSQKPRRCDALAFFVCQTTTSFLQSL